jgi:hypothetical protein
LRPVLVTAESETFHEECELMLLPLAVVTY